MKKRIVLLIACASVVMLSACGTPSVPEQIEVEVPEATEQTVEAVAETSEEVVEEEPVEEPSEEEDLEGIPSSDLPDGWYYTELQEQTEWSKAYTESAEFDGDVLVFKACFLYAPDLSQEVALSDTLYEFNTYLLQATPETVTGGVGGEQPTQEYAYEDFKTKMKEVYQHIGLGCYCHIENGILTEIYVAS